MVRRAETDGTGTVDVLIALTVAGCPLRNEINQRVSAALTAVPGVTGVRLDFTVMTDQEREQLRQRLHGSSGQAAADGGHSHSHGPGHGHAEGRPVPFNEPGSRPAHC